MDYFIFVTLLGYYQAQYAQSKNYNKFYILPSIGARIDKNNHTISTTYMFTTKMPQVLDISTGERLVGYRSFESGSTLLVPQFNHTGLLNYIYGNFEGDFLFYINGIFTYQPRGYRSNWLISSDFNSIEKVENFFANQTSNIMLGIEQYFPKYSFTIKIRPSVSQGIYQNNLNDSDLNRTNRVWEYKLNTSIKSGFLKVFNYNLGINLVWQNIYSQKNIFTQYNTNTYLDLNFKFSKKIKLNVSQELITTKSDGISRQNYYFMNASFLYEVIKSKFSINIDARNLTNTKEFISNAISDFININRSIKLLNRFILLGASYKF